MADGFQTFLGALQDDARFQEEVKLLIATAKPSNVGEIAARISEIARARGIDLSAEDVAARIDFVTGDELGERELEAVAGGAGISEQEMDYSPARPLSADPSLTVGRVKVSLAP